MSRFDLCGDLEGLGFNAAADPCDLERLDLEDFLREVFELVDLCGDGELDSLLDGDPPR